MICASASYAQVNPRLRVSGIVYDKSQVPVEGVNVFLLNKSDSSLVKSSYSNEIGKFELENVSPGCYLLKTRFIGFEQTQEVTLQTEYNDPIYVSLPVEPQLLKEVSVAADRPFIEKRPGKIIINVANSIMASGNTAFEVLERAPGVHIDNADQISMKGKTGVLLAVNGKISTMSFTDLANFLRSIPADNIDQLELISNPGAEFDASGTAGVINILLKENNLGTNGSLSASAGYGTYHKLNSSLTLSNRGQKFNLYGTYNYGNNSRYESVDMMRAMQQTAGVQSFDISNYDVKNRDNHSVKLGLDYLINKQHTVGFLVNRLSTRMSSDERNSTELFFNSMPDSTILTESDETRKISYYTYNAFYRGALGNKKTELSFNADHLSYDRDSDESLINTFVHQPSLMASQQLFRNNYTPSQISIYSAKGDLRHTFSSNTSLRGGMKFSNVSTSSQRLFETLQGNMWVPDNVNSSDFDYSEQISSAYMILENRIKRLSLTTGLRFEQTSASGYSRDLRVLRRNYFNFFPSIQLGYELSEKNVLSFNYNRRINRPVYEDLNPFRYFLDDYSYYQGNPYLKPEYAHTYELSYLRNNTFSATLEYRYTNDFFLQLIDQEQVTGISRLSKQNIDYQEALGITINSPLRWSKGFSTDVNAQLYRISYKLQQANAPIRNSSPELTLSLKNNFRFTDRLKAELSAAYESGVAYGMFNYKPVYVFDAGLNLSFPSQRYSMQLTASDIFNRKANRYASLLKNPNLFTTEKTESRVVRLSFTYRFGQLNSKSPVRNAEPAEESGRINTN